LLTEGPVVIDYFAIGVLVLITLLAVARLFPPPFDPHNRLSYQSADYR